VRVAFALGIVKDLLISWSQTPRTQIEKYNNILNPEVQRLAGFGGVADDVPAVG
jgi:hypothetical protein